MKCMLCSVLVCKARRALAHQRVTQALTKQRCSLEMCRQAIGLTHTCSMYGAAQHRDRKQWAGAGEIQGNNGKQPLEQKARRLRYGNMLYGFMIRTSETDFYCLYCNGKEVLVEKG